MATYAVDSSRQNMITTGIVEPLREWEETSDGRRRPSERQARDEQTGMPLWAIEVLYTQTSFGRESTVTAKVTVPVEHQPIPGRLAPIGFTDLRVDIRVNKAGGFSEVWSADSVTDSSKPVGKQSTASAMPSTASSPAAA